MREDCNKCRNLIFCDSGFMKKCEFQERFMIRRRQMVNEKTWKEFRDSGMLWWINMILHTFGWAITVDIEEDGSISNAYPARVKFRGFSEKINTEGYQKVNQYMKVNADEILNEANN